MYALEIIVIDHGIGLLSIMGFKHFVEPNMYINNFSTIVTTDVYMYNSHAKGLLNTSGRPNCTISTYKLEHPVLKSTEPISDDNIKLRPRKCCKKE